jgi:membrane-bound lytic murein transglycosylase B
MHRDVAGDSGFVAHHGMLTRRMLIAAAPMAASIAPPVAALAAPPQAPALRTMPPGFVRFIAEVKAQARRAGIGEATLTRAFEGVRYNGRVIELDNHQPEFTLTWPQYRDRIVSDARVARGRALYATHRKLLADVFARYYVPPGVIMGIWGIESNFGQSSGGFNVIEALATLAWQGRRAAFFRSELMDALKILDHGDIPAADMVGSYAGAMGQPQFMPDSFLKFAADFHGNGRRDIWNDPADIFASVANYLARSGWTDRLPWGVPARLPQGFDTALAGREHRRPLADWLRLGVQGFGRPMPPDASTAIVLPGGPGGDAFLISSANFQAIRRYNPSDFYCISVGLIGDRVTA